MHLGVQGLNPLFSDTQQSALYRQCGERGVDPVVRSLDSVFLFLCQKLKEGLGNVHFLATLF